MASAWSEYFLSRPEWDVDDVPDQAGKVFFITGGTSALGCAMAKVLLARNAKVYITSRDPNTERARNAMDELRRVSEAIHLLQMDLSDLRSVRRAAHEFMRKERHLHVLVNSAAVGSAPLAQLTKQGYDAQFGVNVLGHFYLTRLLLPVLLCTAKATAQSARVLNFSAALPPAARIDYTTLMDGPVRRRCGLGRLHRQSMVGTLLMAIELAEQYGEHGVLSVAIDPETVHVHQEGLMGAIRHMFSYAPSRAVVTPLFAATSPRAENLNGKLLVPWARVGDVASTLLERGAQETLWDWLDAQTDCFDRAGQRSEYDGGGLADVGLESVTMGSSEVDSLLCDGGGNCDDVNSVWSTPAHKRN